MDCHQLQSFQSKQVRTLLPLNHSPSHGGSLVIFFLPPCTVPSSSPYPSIPLGVSAVEEPTPLPSLPKQGTGVLRQPDRLQHLLRWLGLRRLLPSLPVLLLPRHWSHLQLSAVRPPGLRLPAVSMAAHQLRAAQVWLPFFFFCEVFCHCWELGRFKKWRLCVQVWCFVLPVELARQDHLVCGWFT